VAPTSINSENRLVQHTFASHLEPTLGWESVYARLRTKVTRARMLQRIQPPDAHVGAGAPTGRMKG